MSPSRSETTVEWNLKLLRKLNLTPGKWDKQSPAELAVFFLLPSNLSKPQCPTPKSVHLSYKARLLGSGAIPGRRACACAVRTDVSRGAAAVGVDRPLACPFSSFGRTERTCHEQVRFSGWAVKHVQTNKHSCILGKYIYVPGMNLKACIIPSV